MPCCINMTAVTPWAEDFSLSMLAATFLHFLIELISKYRHLVEFVRLKIKSAWGPMTSGLRWIYTQICVSLTRISETQYDLIDFKRQHIRTSALQTALILWRHTVLTFRHPLLIKQAFNLSSLWKTYTYTSYFKKYAFASIQLDLGV